MTIETSKTEKQREKKNDRKKQNKTEPRFSKNSETTTKGVTYA